MINTQIPKNEAASTDTILRQGDSGSAVAELQRLLNAKGATLVVDGIFGTGTQTAVINFQRSNKLVADGIVGAKTWAALRRVSNQPINLVDVCLHYNPSEFPHQTAALNWLQNQIPAEILDGFARRWRNQ
ncbi:MAG: peptidoglycan-binding protein [Tolypothrix sp. Co-bin9]|nr:peptidoglycan-binding protein [Tolypothrix sp. Co-bin9]